MRIAVDVGSVRVGVAASDPEGRLAFPVDVLQRDLRTGRDVDELVAIIAEREAVEVVVGLPQTLRGRDSSSTADARAYATTLAARVAPVPVQLFDERLTTVSAAQQLRTAGRDSRSSRGIMDAAAAVLLLDAALDRERHTGIPAGEQVHP